ncbi:MAG: ferredoxin [Candidatus Brocadiales bacterium]
MRLSRREFLINSIGAMCLLVPCAGWSSALAEGRLRAVVNLKRCNGCETCIDVCPEVFAIKNERAEVKLDSIPPELEGCAIEAADECMAGAITIVEG